MCDVGLTPAENSQDEKWKKGMQLLQSQADLAGNSKFCLGGQKMLEEHPVGKWVLLLY